MMEFERYTHIEKLGTTEVNGLLDGECYVFPKIDGTNASVWLNKNGEVQAGSRKRHLELDNDNAGFFAHIKEDKNIASFFKEHPSLRLFGEWLVPHSLKTYRDEAWKKFYVFDVMSEIDFMSYDVYSSLLEKHNIEYIPPIFKVTKPTKERLFDSLQVNDFLIKDGNGVGEGVVIKNYSFVNCYGRTSWAKIITSEFKAKHTKALGVREVKEKIRVEDAIAADFVTHALVEKVQSKIINDSGSFGSKDIPRLLNTVYYDIVREDIWEILKKYKNPAIDFKSLKNAIFNHTKIYKPELF